MDVNYGDVVELNDEQGFRWYTGRVMGWTGQNRLILRITESQSGGIPIGSDCFFVPSDWRISKRDAQET